ncbi:MAG: hypothetical protein M1818_001042 [Claussenomyces sp. TS43310]|nr:MAG: hypothetical protein M1818_001042 [Claussenomyces sp. TS43310]
MATLSSSASSIHKDIRSESRGYQRGKEHSYKWAYGARDSVNGPRKFPSIDGLIDYGEYKLPTQQRPGDRPMKKYSDLYSATRKDHANIPAKAASGREYPRAVRGRVDRRQDALGESSNHGVDKSLIDLLPSSTRSLSRSLSPDYGVTYSFDAASSAWKAVNFDGLVERAERDFNARETDKMVETEYEVLDDFGQSMTRTKKGKKGIAKQKATVVRSSDEDDWERVSSVSSASW